MYDLVVLDAHERDAAKTAIVVKDAVHAIMCQRDQLDGPGADAGFASIGVLRVVDSLVVVVAGLEWRLVGQRDGAARATVDLDLGTGVIENGYALRYVIDGCVVRWVVVFYPARAYLLSTARQS